MLDDLHIIVGTYIPKNKYTLHLIEVDGMGFTILCTKVVYSWLAAIKYMRDTELEYLSKTSALDDFDHKRRYPALAADIKAKFTEKNLQRYEKIGGFITSVVSDFTEGWIVTRLFI